MPIEIKIIDHISNKNKLPIKGSPYSHQLRPFPNKNKPKGSTLRSSMPILN